MDDEGPAYLGFLMIPFLALAWLPVQIRAKRYGPGKRYEKALQVLVFLIGLGCLIYLVSRDANQSLKIEWLAQWINTVRALATKAWSMAGAMLFFGCILSLGSPWLVHIFTDVYEDGKPDHKDG